MTSAPAIGFEYRPSRWVPRALAGAVVLALLSIALCCLPVWAKLAFVVAVPATVLAGWKRRAPPPASVGWSADSGWILHARDGSASPAELRSHRAGTHGLVLDLHSGTGRHVLWLLPDNSDADIRRRLRMRLAGSAPAHRRDG